MFAAGWLPCISSSRTGSCTFQHVPTDGDKTRAFTESVPPQYVGALFDSKRNANAVCVCVSSAALPPDLPRSKHISTHAHMQTKSTLVSTAWAPHPSPLSLIMPSPKPPPPRFPPWPCEFPTGQWGFPEPADAFPLFLMGALPPQCTLLQG